MNAPVILFIHGFPELWYKRENNVFIQSPELIIYKIQSVEYGKLVKERIQNESLILAIVIRKIQDTDPSFTVTNH